MKKVTTFSSVILFLSFTTGFCGISFDGLGTGGQISVVVPEKQYFGGDGPAFGFGFQGMAQFNLGRFGAAQYIPSFTFWFNSDKMVINTEPREERKGQVTLNLFDVKYFPPTADIFIKLYVGVSALPCIVVNTYHEERNGIDYRSWRDTDPGFNFFGGIEFPVSTAFVPYVEWRITATRNWAMRLTGGFLICFL